MFRVVLVEPLYPVNIGSVCRVMRNFDASQLYLVNPRTEISHEAFKYAKHAQDILEKARIVNELRHAVGDCDLVAGTTGIVRRFGYSLKSCITPRELAEKADKRDKIALVFGNEGTGLSLAQLKECDAVVSIPASGKHPVLNLSHSVAVVLYELFLSRKNYFHYAPAKRAGLKSIEDIFGETLSFLPEIRDRKKVQGAFRNVLRRSRVSEEELQALFVAFGGLRKRVKARGQ